MNAHIPENVTPKVEEIIQNNELMESIFANLGEGEDGGLKAVFSALALPEREFAFVSEQILSEC